MGHRAPRTSSHSGETTAGGKNGDPTSRNQNPATHNTHPLPSSNRAIRMEKPHLADQHQCPISHTVTTHLKEPVTPKPSSGDQVKPTSSGTHNVRHETTTGPTQMPAFPATTTTQASGAHGRSPTRVAPRILLGTTLGPCIRATSATLPTIPITLATQKPCAHDLYTGHHTASGRRSGMGPTGSAPKGGGNPHVRS